MGKGEKNQKNKDPASSLNVNSVPNRDIMQRLNFMYQASTLLHSIASTGSEAGKEVKSGAQAAVENVSMHSGSKVSRKKAKGIRPRQDKKPTAVRKGLDAVAQFYAQSIPVVAQRTTVKMDPSVKRGLCKGCNSPLIPGMTITTRIKKQPSHGHFVVSQCNGCKALQRIPAPAEPLTVIRQEETPAPSRSLEEDSMAMDVDHPPPDRQMDEDPSASVKQGNTPPKGASHYRKHPRVPPLFARGDAGHILFRGSERIECKHDKES